MKTKLWKLILQIGPDKGGFKSVQYSHNPMPHHVVNLVTDLNSVYQADFVISGNGINKKKKEVKYILYSMKRIPLFSPFEG